MRAFVFSILFFSSCRQNSQTDFIGLSELDNSSLIIVEGENQFYLSRCQVIKSKDSIFMNFSDTSKHSNWYELQIIKVNNNFLSKCYTLFSIADSSYKRPILKTYRQTITLDKSSYDKGDSIKGNISLGISSYNQWPEVYTDTLKINGGFRAIVQ